MTRAVLCAIALPASIGTWRAAEAAPAWGGNCLGCHDVVRPECISIYGESGVVDPDESVTGAVDRGALKAYRLAPGQSRRLYAEVAWLSAGDRYAVELKRFRFPGVENGGSLAYSPDCAWSQWQDPGDHYTDPPVGHVWGEGPSLFTFELTATADAAYDYFDLVFAVAGKIVEDDALFYAEEHFYLQITPLGDVDADGDIDLTDYLLLGFCMSGAGVTSPPPGCSAGIFEVADLDEDGDVDLGDFAVMQASFGQ